MAAKQDLGRTPKEVAAEYPFEVRKGFTHKSKNADGDEVALEFVAGRSYPTLPEYEDEVDKWEREGKIEFHNHHGAKK